MPRLRRSDTSGPGFRRVRSGRGFRYTTDEGDPIDAATRERAAALVIPPAWTDVWIAPNANGHIQATGVDGAGRRQYISVQVITTRAGWLTSNVISAETNAVTEP